MWYLLHNFTMNDSTYILNQELYQESVNHQRAAFNLMLYDIMFAFENTAVFVSLCVVLYFNFFNNTLLLVLKIVILFLIFQLKDIIALVVMDGCFDKVFKSEICCSVISLSLQVMTNYFFRISNSSDME